MLPTPHHRRKPRMSGVRAPFGLVIALLALTAQLSLPWIKGSHDALERRAVGNPLPGVSRVLDHEIFAGLDDDRGQTAHDSATCPVCRLISQSRSALVMRTSQPTTTPLIGGAVGSLHAGTPRRCADNTAAPRAPPLLFS